MASRKASPHCLSTGWHPKRGLFLVYFLLHEVTTSRPPSSLDGGLKGRSYQAALFLYLL